MSSCDSPCFVEKQCVFEGFEPEIFIVMFLWLRSMRSLLAGGQ